LPKKIERGAREKGEAFLKTFFKYLVINLVLIPVYILLFFMAAMGLGGRTGTESNGELMYNIFLGDKGTGTLSQRKRKTGRQLTSYLPVFLFLFDKPGWDNKPVPLSLCGEKPSSLYIHC
jgi:hypothetical protein